MRVIERMVKHSLAHVSRGPESRHHLSREAPRFLTEETSENVKGSGP